MENPAGTLTGFMPGLEDPVVSEIDLQYDTGLPATEKVRIYISGRNGYE